MGALPETPVRNLTRCKGRAPSLQRPVEGVPALLRSTYKGSPQSGESGYGLLARPFRSVAGALARGAGLLQPLGLLPEPHGPLEVLGVSVEVLANASLRPGLQPRCKNGSGIESQRVQSYERPL